MEIGGVIKWGVYAMYGVIIVAMVVITARGALGQPRILADEGVDTGPLVTSLNSIPAAYTAPVLRVDVRAFQCQYSDGFAWYVPRRIVLCRSFYEAGGYDAVLRHEVGHVYAYAHELYGETSYDDRERIAWRLAEKMDVR